MDKKKIYIRPAMEAVVVESGSLLVDSDWSENPQLPFDPEVEDEGFGE